VENPQIMLYVIVDAPHVESQSTSGAGALLFHDIMSDLLPYMNIYQSSDESIIYNGTDEPAVSSFEGDEVSTEEGDTEEGASSEEGETSEDEQQEDTQETYEETGDEASQSSENTTEEQRVLDE
jgi:stage V sporulation protein D (sporulation-specific penicillin-binding protein)